MFRFSLFGVEYGQEMKWYRVYRVRVVVVFRGADDDIMGVARGENIIGLCSN